MCDEHEVIKRELEVVIRQKENLLRRLNDIETKYNEVSEARNRLISENNEFRLIGCASNPDAAPDSIITESMYAASHLISIDSWDVETRVLFLNRLNKHAELFAISIQKSRNKVEIKQHIIEQSKKESATSQAKIAIDEREARRRSVYKDFHKMITGIMKSSKCSEAAALTQVRSMGILVPVDY